MKTRTFLSFTAPSIVMMVGLMALPIGLTVWLGFHRMTFRGEVLWAGFDNYERALTDPDFWRSVEFTLLFCAITVPAKILIGFVTALALDKVVGRGLRGFFIACALLPFIVTPVVGTLSFSWLFRDFGVVNYWLAQLGLGVHWLANEWNTRALVILHYIWHGAPFATIVLFAGLQTVPKDELEAAIVDGANWWYRLWFVVIPHLMPLFVFLALIMTMDAYRVFDSIAILTRGLNGTESVMWYNYRVGILENSITRGSAVSLLTIVGILVLLVPFLWNTWREMRTQR